MEAKIIAVCSNAGGGIPKIRRERIVLLADRGVEGDYHSGKPGKEHRQVSLIEQETLDDLVAQGIAVEPGSLGENITVQGLSLASLKAGFVVRAGTALLEVTEARDPCATLVPIDRMLPKRVMGRAGVFCRVIEGGEVQPGDEIAVVEGSSARPLA